MMGSLAENEGMDGQGLYWGMCLLHINMEAHKGFRNR